MNQPRKAATPNTHKGWYSRGYLPHFDQPNLVQSITIRLADALPADVVEWLMTDGRFAQTPAQRRRLEQFLDAGYGACHLQQPAIGRLVENALHYFDGDRYALLAWVVLPNHVHALIETRDGHPLQQIIHSWKSYTAHEANDRLGRSGPFWYHDFYDRYIRDARHFANVVRYIHQNPVVAGLVTAAEAWPFSSARWFAGQSSDLVGSQAGRLRSQGQA